MIWSDSDVFMYDYILIVFKMVVGKYLFLLTIYVIVTIIDFQVSSYHEAYGDNERERKKIREIGAEIRGTKGKKYNYFLVS